MKLLTAMIMIVIIPSPAFVQEFHEVSNPLLPLLQAGDCHRCILQPPLSKVVGSNRVNVFLFMPDLFDFLSYYKVIL